MYSKRGMTFIEALVWIGVFLTAMWAIVGSILSFYRANTYTLEQAQAVSEARRSIERVVMTLRETNYSSEGAYPIVSMSTSSITFYADIDGDPLIERVRFSLVGKELQQGILNPTGDPPAYTAPEVVNTIAYFIRNAEQHVDAFHYFDITGAAINIMTNVTAVRFITIDTVVNVSPDRLPNELTLRSSATLRNLR